MLLPVIILSFVPFIFALNNSTLPRIIGGQPARGGQFPSAAAIYSTINGGTFFCGGSLITNQWVLTAAQCINGASAFRIQLGSNSLQGTDPNRVTLATATYVVHPLFNLATLENDIGLIKLRLPIDFSPYLQSISPPVANIADYTQVTAIGWGQTNDFDTTISDVLNYVTATTITNTECKGVYGNQILDHMVCIAGNFNEGTCRGDSGTPLIQTIGTSSYVVGVSSFYGNNGCDTADPSGYTRIFDFIDWIRGTIVT